MAYFPKRPNNKKGTYLQIFESFYDPVRRADEERYSANRRLSRIGKSFIRIPIVEYCSIIGYRPD